MNRTISRALRGPFIVFFAMVTATATADDVSHVDIVNDTGHAFADLFLSPSSSREWGPDLLDGMLHDEEAYSLVNIPCDQYDLMIVEDNGDECLLPAIPLCGSKEVWTFTADSWRDCVTLKTVAAALP